jgi:hypothetical protein
MTDEQINVAIAGACGWIAHSLWHTAKDIPSYCTDLNAMHKAEKVLDIKQVELFADIMYNLCVEGKVTTPNRLGWRFALLNATARQRAEAFLRTVGKWEDAK